MKKLFIALAVVATLAVAMVTAGVAFAQGTQPPTPQAPGYGGGFGGMMGGMMGGRGLRATGSGYGIMHETMIAVFAEELGLSADELNARLGAGETMAQIAADKGLDTDAFVALMNTARTQAIDKALADGTLTQEQADWMKQHGAQMNGMMQGGMGRWGRMMGGLNGGNMPCPYFNQTNP